jgi:hypothetical protein
MWRWPSLLAPLLYLGAGIGVPVFVLVRWTMGSAQKAEPMSLAFAQKSFQKAVDQGLPDLMHSVWLAIFVALCVALLALPLARKAGRGSRWIEVACAVPIASPAILLGIGLILAYNSGPLAQLFGNGFYDGWGFALCGYVARMLPFAALTLAAQVRRVPLAGDEGEPEHGGGGRRCGLEGCRTLNRRRRLGMCCAKRRHGLLLRRLRRRLSCGQSLLMSHLGSCSLRPGGLCVCPCQGHLSPRLGRLGPGCLVFYLPDHHLLNLLDHLNGHLRDHFDKHLLDDLHLLDHLRHHLLHNPLGGAQGRGRQGLRGLDGGRGGFLL